MKRTIGLVWAACAIFTSSPAPASAEGANSIAAAPVVPFRQLQTGDTTGGEKFGGRVKYKSFWKLKVRAGDKVTIDWEARSGTHIEVFPVGTTDFTVAHAKPLRRQVNGTTGRNELRFTAPVGGTMPLAFEAYPNLVGPYAFTAYVKHWRPGHHHRPR